MTEMRDGALVRWGEQLRRERAGRRMARRRVAIVAASAAAATALTATLLAPLRPRLLWNASASSPVGLYRVTARRDVRPGDMVAAWAPPDAHALAAERGYLPLTAPLVKRVAAAGRDRVCAAGEAVFINGEVAALRRDADPSGRPLPWWTGCEELREGEIFLLGASAGSFDGRYFGVTQAGDVIGEARLLWAR